jgi:hypothetical protein
MSAPLPPPPPRTYSDRQIRLQRTTSTTRHNNNKLGARPQQTLPCRLQHCTVLLTTTIITTAWQSGPRQAYRHTIRYSYFDGDGHKHTNTYIDCQAVTQTQRLGLEEISIRATKSVPKQMKCMVVGTRELPGRRLQVVERKKMVPQSRSSMTRKATYRKGNSCRILPA